MLSFVNNGKNYFFKFIYLKLKTYINYKFLKLLNITYMFDSFKLQPI